MVVFVRTGILYYTLLQPHFTHIDIYINMNMQKTIETVALFIALFTTRIQQAAAQDPHFPVYCQGNGYCHVPALPDSCSTDMQCVTPWYNSYCQSSGTCHLELPPKCKTDADCAPKGV